MEDQVAALEKHVDDLEQQLSEFRRDVVDRVGRSFKWTMATVVVAVLATWFGVFMFLTRGAGQLRQLLQLS